MKPPLVISLGGSVIAPSAVDVRFLRRFARLVQSVGRRSQRLFIICGGGGTSRSYVRAARATGARRTIDLHWIGVRACQLNAELVRSVLGVQAPTLTNISRLRRSRAPVTVVAPSIPGSTSDFVCVRVARVTGARTIVNVTNVDGVYSHDPRRYRTARHLRHMRWSELQRLVGTRVTPGMHAPFDPLAARAAAAAGLRLLVVGKHVSNLQRAMRGASFRGTTIA